MPNIKLYPLQYSLEQAYATGSESIRIMDQSSSSMQIYALLSTTDRATVGYSQLAQLKKARLTNRRTAREQPLTAASRVYDPRFLILAACSANSQYNYKAIKH